ncbi:tetratricopeptide repeat protein [Fulvivirga sediminis]|uniref:Tetratricopeptide repeat protein n=1 Tax=Fulvivirga sediminis TaxID=2803949 RepID=A0A937FB99_9BACT|nr:tetratricopeptide repeat protein [Fulvivirga sediminis]MBL3659060.1 hypothetical protein [Fulvivirga sediminis]
MELERSLYKAEHLMNQGRYGEAIKEVNTHLAADPESIPGLIMLVQIYMAMSKDEKADEVADQLLARKPDDFTILYLKAITLSRLAKRKEALKFVNSALAYNPHMADAHGLKASIFYHDAEFEKSLEAANAGLSEDAHNETCLNFRSMALLKLGRAEDHFNADQEALKTNPMNPTTHATVGFSALEKGESDKAKEHFREALRIDPSNEYARSGMMMAIKSTNIFYALFLKYVFWMSGLKPQVRWGVVIIGYLLIQGLSRYSDALGAFEPIAQVIIILYMIFAISTWIINPVSNVFLRFHSFGKYLLSEEDIKVANVCAGLLLLSLCGAVGIFLFDESTLQWYNLSFYLVCIGIALTVVVSSVSNRTLERSKRRLKSAGLIYAIASGVLILLALATPGLALKFFNIWMYGFIGYQFFANSQE